MNHMGLFHYLSDWKNNLYEKKIAQAENLGCCPECSGKGFQIPFVNEFSMPEIYECIECNGTGTFAGWHKNNRKKQ